jgi:hypothetical protein
VSPPSDIGLFGSPGSLPSSGSGVGGRELISESDILGEGRATLWIKGLRFARSRNDRKISLEVDRKKSFDEVEMLLVWRFCSAFAR